MNRSSYSKDVAEGRGGNREELRTFTPGVFCVAHNRVFWDYGSNRCPVGGGGCELVPVTITEQQT
jgi:hypothetical protein